LPLLILVLVIVLVGVILLAAFLAVFFLPLSRTPQAGAPSVALGSVGFVNGNVTFDVTSVSSTSPAGFFEVNLRVGPTAGSPQPLETDPADATIRVANDRYRIYFLEVSSFSFLNAGDRFVVTGDGRPLPMATSFTFNLLWLVNGKTVASTNWSEQGQSKPVVTFSSVDQSSGSTTIYVSSASQAVVPSNFQLNLQVSTNTGTAVAMPPVGGLFVTMTIGGTTYRIYWTDIGGERTLNAGDYFRVAGSNAALPAATSFTFYLLWGDGSSIQSISWSTL